MSSAVLRLEDVRAKALFTRLVFRDIGVFPDSEGFNRAWSQDVPGLINSVVCSWVENRGEKGDYRIMVVESPMSGPSVQRLLLWCGKHTVNVGVYPLERFRSSRRAGA